MKIAITNYHASIPSKSAESIFLIRMAEAYAMQGHDVTLLVSKPKLKDFAIFNKMEIFSFYDVKSNFQIIRFPKTGFKYLDYFFLIIFIPLFIKVCRFDFVHAKNISSAWFLTCVLQKGCILELHDSPNKHPRIMAQFNAFSKSRYNKGILTITTALANHLKEFTKSKIEVFPDAIKKEYLDNQISKEEARKLLGINSRKVVVYTGHLYNGRGIPLIIKLAQKFQDIDFYIVGGEKFDIDKFKSKSKEIKNLNYTGFITPSKVRFYQFAADILLMPYENKVSVEGGGDTSSYMSPMKLFEYMASNRLILASNHNSIQEVLSHKKNAILIPYDEFDKWQQTVIDFFQFRERFSSIVSNAFLGAGEFTWEKRAKFVLREFYEDCICNR